MNALGLNHKIGLWAFLLLLLLGQQVTLAATGEMEYRLERIVPQQAQSWRFYSPMSIASASDGSVWIVDAKGIQHLNADGTFIAQFSPPSDQNGLTYMPKNIAASATDQGVWVLYRIPDSTLLLVQHLAADGSSISQFKMEDPSGYPIDVALATDGSLWTLSNKHVQHFKSNGTLIAQFGKEGSGVGQFYNPESIAISWDGSVWVSDWNPESNKNFRVQHFTPDGIFMGQFEVQGGILSYPPSIAVAIDGSLWVANSSSHHIEHFSPDGALIRRLGNGEFTTSILGIAISPDGSIWTSDSRANCLQHFNNSGAIIADFCTQEAHNAALHTLGNIAVAADGSIWVVDSYATAVMGGETIRRLLHFSSSGNFIEEFKNQRINAMENVSPNAVSIATDGSLWLVDGKNNRLQHFKTNGTFIEQFGIPGTDAGQLDSPYLIATSPDGSVWVADSSLVTKRIQHFRPDGSLIAQFGSFESISDLQAAPDGSVWIVDGTSIGTHYNHSRIQHLNADGTSIALFDNYSSGIIGPYSFFSSVAVEADGSVWVVDTGNNSIQHFNADGSHIDTLTVAFSSFGKIAVGADRSLWISNSNFSGSPSGQLNKFALRPKPTTAHPYKAIVVAGSGERINNHTNEFWEGTWQVTQKTHKALQFQGFITHEEILYLTAGNTQFDLDANGQLDDMQAATKGSLRQAIIDWAKDSTDVVIFLAGQTSVGRFQLNATETLSADELSTWLTGLEKKLPANGKVTVVIEAPNAGSFAVALANPARPRYVIASTQAGQPALMADHGVNSFSYTFWSQVMDGATLKEAFIAAQQAFNPFGFNGQLLQALGDTNGDGQANQQDAVAVGDYCLGMCTKTAAEPPVIGLSDQPKITLKAATSLDFNITVQHKANLLEAWALVQRPEQSGIDANRSLNLEKITLICDDQQDKCHGRYYRFDAQGQYRINFYALDTQYKLSTPVTLTVTQPQQQAAIPAEYDDRQALLYLYDVSVNGQHYEATLQYQDGLYRLLTLGLTPNVLSPSAHFDAVTNLLDIPLARVDGLDYQASFKMIESGHFKVLSVSPK